MARRDRRNRENLSIRDHGTVRRQIERDRRRNGPPRSYQPRAAFEDPARALDRISVALLVLRVFLGITFIYAGLDKLIDPTFLRSAGPGSIAAQLAAFARYSPITPLIQIFAQPFPIFTGLVISIAEIAVGVGTLTGLLFRTSATGGALLSILFWLTASWATTPYFYGPDLPYAAAWVTLAISGDGGRFVLASWLDRLVDLDETDDETWPIGRRQFIEGSVVALGALALAALGGTFGSTIFSAPAPASPGLGAGAGEPSTGPQIDPGSNAPSAINGTTSTPTGAVVGTVAKLNQRSSLAFLVPSNGDPGVVLKLSNGTYVAFDAVCTHAGCTVRFDPGQQVLACPCHGATFDPAHHGAVLGGPTDIPLTQLPIKVDARTGVITLSG